MNKKHFQLFTQAIGMITLTLFAIYGLLSAVGIVTPTVSADDHTAGISTAEEVGINTTDDLNGRAVANNPSVPAYFNYEGTLREPDGSLTNSTVGVRAVLYTLATGGDVKFVEDFPNTNVRDGQFNIVLGENSSYDLLTAFETAPLYMGITLDKDNNGSYETEVLPRERVHGVPWSIYSQNAEHSFDGVPVGGIIDWYRPTERWNGAAWEAIPANELLPVPDGYLPCDGRGFDDPLGISPLDRTSLPDLRGRFTLGASDLADIHTYGGGQTHNHTTGSEGNHNHLWSYIDSNKDMWGYNGNGTLEGFSWGDGMDTGGSGYYFFGDELSDIPNYWYTNYGGSHTHSVSSSNHMPPYIELYKLCRIY